MDPHIKIESSYKLHDEIHARDLYVKNKDGGNYEGWCWPGKGLNNATVEIKGAVWIIILITRMTTLLAHLHPFLFFRSAPIRQHWLS